MGWRFQGGLGIVPPLRQPSGVPEQSATVAEYNALPGKWVGAGYHQQDWRPRSTRKDP